MVLYRLNSVLDENLKQRAQDTKENKDKYSKAKMTNFEYIHSTNFT